LRPGYERLKRRKSRLPIESATAHFHHCRVLGRSLCVPCLALRPTHFTFCPKIIAARRHKRSTLQAQNTEVQRIIDSTSTAVELAKIEAAYTATPTLPDTTDPPRRPPAKPRVLSPPLRKVRATQRGLVGQIWLQLPRIAATWMPTPPCMPATLTARPLQPTEYYPIPDLPMIVGLPLMLGMAVLLWLSLS